MVLTLGMIIVPRCFVVSKRIVPRKHCEWRPHTRQTEQLVGIRCQRGQDHRNVACSVVKHDRLPQVVDPLIEVA